MAEDRTFPAPGVVIAEKYRVDRLLGVGGMAYVLGATHLQLDEPVALKMLRHEAAREPDLVKRFVREAKAATKIRSEHVVRVLDVGRTRGGAPFMVMELLEGSDLDAVLKASGPQAIGTIVDYVLQACEALAEAHVLGMVHRDLKPANLFVTKRADGKPLVKVLDFGISKVTGSGGADLGMTSTHSGVMGSPLYMSPEQMRSLRDVDSRSDIWSLGVVMYELCIDSAVWKGTTMVEVAAAILRDPVPPLSRVFAGVPPPFEAAVLRCLEKDPSARFQNVGDLARALAEFASVEGRASIARICGVLEAAGVGPESVVNVVELRESGSMPSVIAATSTRTSIAVDRPAPTAWGQTARIPGSRLAAAVGIGLGAALLVAVLAISAIVVMRPRRRPEVAPPVAAATIAEDAPAPATSATPGDAPAEASGEPPVAAAPAPGTSLAFKPQKPRPKAAPSASVPGRPDLFEGRK